MDAITAAHFGLAALFLIVTVFIDWRIPLYFIGCFVAITATLGLLYLGFKWLGLE